MEQILDNIHTTTSGTAVIIGSLARFLNGHIPTEPARKWIDITIHSDYVDNVRALGTPREIKGGTSFVYPITNQFIVQVEGYFLDVFVNNTETPSTEVQGRNVITPEGDLNWHVDLLMSQPSQMLHNKVVRLRSLYSQ